MLDGLTAANEAVGVSAAAKVELAGMGTTLVAAIVGEDDVSWISVGDSPFYLIADGQLARLNADHSMVPQIEALAARGVLTREEAEHIRAAYAARSDHGRSADLDRSGTRRLPVDARLLLCSDGVQTLVDDDLLARGNAGPARKLVEAVLAVREPHQDNITVVLVEREK